MLARQIFSSIVRSQKHLPRLVTGSRNFSENSDGSSSSSSSDSDSELDSSDASVKELEDIPTDAYILPSRSDGYTEGTFLQMPKNLFDRLYGIYGFEPYQKELFEVLDDTGIMIRDPYFQLVDYINKTNFDLPVNRYVLYGRYGTGKTYILNSMAHYGYHHNFVIVHLSAPHEWVNEPHEMELSETRPSRLDYPLNAALALKHFKSQNSTILKRLNLRISKKYTWSIREAAEKGDPLVNVIDHGIGRMKHSSDCYAVLLKELKLLANAGACKLMVICDSINVLYDKPKVKHPDGRVISVEEITLTRAFMKLLQHDWKNGLLIASTNKKTDNLRLRLDKYFPKHLLTDRGFEDLDPFIPIEVKDYSEIETDSCLDYYTQRNFLNRPPAKTKAGRDEIKFLTANNPQEVYKFCSAL